MPKNATDDPLEDTGLAIEDVAATLSVVYARISGINPDDVADGPWAAVANAAAAMFAHDDGADDGEITIPVSQLASQLRRAYARTAGTEDEIVEFGELPPKFRLAWEGVTRHAANVFGMDKTEASRLGSHEDRIVTMMARRLSAAPPT